MVDAADTGNDKSAVGMLCPTCRIDLVMSERQGIEIDYCPKCRGVWLDRGELDKIIERSANEERSARPPPAEEPYTGQFPGQQQPAPWSAAPAQPPPAQYYPPQGQYSGGHGSGHGGHGSSQGGHGGGHGQSRKHGSFLGRLFD